MADLAAPIASSPPAAPPTAPPLRLLTRAGLSGLAVLFLVKAIAFSGARRTPVEFDWFHLAGRLARSGHAAAPYHADSFFAAMRKSTGGVVHLMPWSYPPPFEAVMAALAALPLGLAYGLFTGATLLAFLWVLRRAAGERFGIVLAATLPTLALGVSCGQNGMLTGALGGAAALLLAARKPGAGLPLGLLVIKPHLAAGLAAHALAGRRWDATVLALAVVTLSAAFSTLVLGTGVWPAFAGGAREAAAFLHAGLYPLFRMVSVYATLRTLHVPDTAALATQAMVALAALAGVVRLASDRAAPPRRAAGFAAMACLVFSPYVYDYDLPLFGVGLALLLPDLERFAASAERAAVLALFGAAGAFGLATTGLLEATGADAGAAAVPSVGGLLLAGALFLVWRALERGRGDTVAAPHAAFAAHEP